MSRVTVDAKKYLDDLDAAMADMAKYTWERNQEKRQNPVNGVDLADLLEPHIGSNYARALRDGNVAEISAMVMDKGMFKLIPYDLFSTWRKVYDYLDLLSEGDDLSMTEDQIYESYRVSVQNIVDESKTNLDALVGRIEKAIKRFKDWSGVHDVVIEPMYNSESGLTSSVNGGYVRIGDRMGFTAYLKGSKVDVLEVLEGQDSYFFQNPADESDYFGLVRELESPGSTSKPGKWLILWTARPTKDRRRYERARVVPPGIFLTTDPDRAYGIASDLGGREVRDLWRVVINEQSLMKTLDRGWLRDYQVVGVEPAPIKSMDLVAEGTSQRMANRIAGWFALSPDREWAPEDASLIAGDPTMDVMDDALKRLSLEYWLIDGRPPYPEEVRHSLQSYIENYIHEWEADGHQFRTLSWMPHLLEWLDVDHHALWALGRDLILLLGKFFRVGEHRPEYLEALERFRPVLKGLVDTPDPEVLSISEGVLKSLQEQWEWLQERRRKEGATPASRVEMVKRIAGWWAVKDHPDLVVGDSVLDIIGDAVDEIFISYWSSWGRPPRPEELERVLAQEHVFDGSHVPAEWFPRLTTWLGVSPERTTYLGNETLKLLGWFFKNDGTNTFRTFLHKAEVALAHYRPQVLELIETSRRSWVEGGPVRRRLHESLEALRKVLIDISPVIGYQSGPENGLLEIWTGGALVPRAVADIAKRVASYWPHRLEQWYADHDKGWDLESIAESAVAEFNNGFSHFVRDDHCYVLLNGGGPSSWLFDEALDVLKSLPSDPDHARPLSGGPTNHDIVQGVVEAYMQKMAGYYRLKPRTSVDEVIRRWSENGDKATDDSMPQWYNPRELSPHKEYRWTRDNARSGFARVEGQTRGIWMEGPMKWDVMREHMRRHGWDPKDPMHFAIGRDGSAKVSEGNHRLAIAEKLNIPVPVRFHFHTGRVTKSPQPGETPKVSPKALKTVVEEVRGPMSPEEQKRVDEIMDLLGF